MVSLVQAAAAAEPPPGPHDCPFLRPLLQCPPQGRAGDEPVPAR